MSELSPYDEAWKSAGFEERWAAMDRRRVAGYGAYEGHNRLNVRWQIRTTVIVDLAGLIHENLHAYWSDRIMTEHSCYEEWQRPEALLYDGLTSEWAMSYTATHSKSLRGPLDYPEIDYRWTEKDFEELIERNPDLDPEGVVARGWRRHSAVAEGR